jgi:hypothetical protein
MFFIVQHCDVVVALKTSMDIGKKQLLLFCNSQNFVVGGDIQMKMIHNLLVVVMEYII